jgi:hypothetical protein
VGYQKLKSGEKFTILDSEGEVVERQIGIFEKRGPKLPNFVFLFCEGLLQIIRADLRGKEINFLLYLLTQVNYENRFFVDHALCFANTGILRSNQYKHLKALQAAQLIFLAEKENSRQYFKFTPLLAWKGNSFYYHPAVQQFQNLQELHGRLDWEDEQRTLLRKEG